MAWTHIANRGTMQNKTAANGAFLTIALTGTVAVGRVLVIWAAWDEIATSGGGFDNEQMNKVVDTQGNRYVQIHHSKSLGISGALYVGRISTQLTNADSITIHGLPDQWGGAPAGAFDIVAKAASVHEFSNGTNGYWCRRFAWDWDAWAAASGDVPDLVIGSGNFPNEQHLLLHALAVEGPNTDNYTWDADYTQITGTGTTGGAADENVHIRGGWRIATLTGDTVGITSTTADRDLQHFLGAIGEVSLPSGELTFPQFEVVDDFDRADETPLASKWWEKDPTGGGWGGTSFQTATDTFDIVGNEVVASTADVSTEPDSYGKYFWNDDVPCQYAEVWATLSSVPSDDSVTRPVPEPDTNYSRRGMGVGWGPVSGAFEAGYEVGYWRRADKYAVGIGWQPHDQLHFHFPGQFFRTQMHIGDMAAGHRIGLQMIAGRFFHVYADTGSGWEWRMCHDTGNGSGGGVYTYFRPFRPVLRVGGKNTAVDDFGGGHPCFKPDIIRRLEMPTT